MLHRYAEILKLYADNREYALGFKKRPKQKVIEIENIVIEKNKLEDKLHICWRYNSKGIYFLDMQGLSNNSGSCKEEDLKYWFVFPLNSSNKNVLENLSKILPCYFTDKKFNVREATIDLGY